MSDVLHGITLQQRRALRRNHHAKYANRASTTVPRPLATYARTLVFLLLLHFGNHQDVLP